jgi:hypothetical protein
MIDVLKIQMVRKIVVELQSVETVQNAVRGFAEIKIWRAVIINYVLMHLINVVIINVQLITEDRAV